MKSRCFFLSWNIAVLSVFSVMHLSLRPIRAAECTFSVNLSEGFQFNATAEDSGFQMNRSGQSIAFGTNWELTARNGSLSKKPMLETKAGDIHAELSLSTKVTTESGMFIIKATEGSCVWPVSTSSCYPRPPQYFSLPAKGARLNGENVDANIIKYTATPANPIYFAVYYAPLDKTGIYLLNPEK
ncbi:hypothetical protein JW979_05930 [bacterium]|nr:hypothetical protein [candidate division CSSED10-310 bacterium]